MTPHVARSVFARKFPRDTDRGVARWVRQDLFFEGWRGVARHPRDISKIAGICCDTLCATSCSAIGVTARVCHEDSHKKSQEGVDEGAHGSVQSSRQFCTCPVRGLNFSSKMGLFFYGKGPRKERSVGFLLKISGVGSPRRGRGARRVSAGNLPIDSVRRRPAS